MLPTSKTPTGHEYTVVYVQDGYFTYTVLADTQDGFLTVRDPSNCVHRLLKNQTVPVSPTGFPGAWR